MHYVPLVAYFKLNNSTIMMFNLAKLKLSYRLREVHSEEETILKGVVVKEFYKLGELLYIPENNYLQTCFCCTLFCSSIMDNFRKNIGCFIF